MRWHKKKVRRGIFPSVGVCLLLLSQKTLCVHGAEHEITAVEGGGYEAANPLWFDGHFVGIAGVQSVKPIFYVSGNQRYYVSACSGKDLCLSDEPCGYQLLILFEPEDVALFELLEDAAAIYSCNARTWSNDDVTWIGVKQKGFAVAGFPVRKGEELTTALARFAVQSSSRGFPLAHAEIFATMTEWCSDQRVSCRRPFVWTGSMAWSTPAPLFVKSSSLPPGARELIAHVHSSIENARVGISKLSGESLTMHGMTSNKGRHLLNNLCQHPGVRYLEIGSYTGSSLVACSFRNQESMMALTAVDDFSLFGKHNPRERFFSNVEQHIGWTLLQFREQDAFNMPLPNIKGGYNMYFYDAGHTELDHYHSLIKIAEALANVFVLLVDDWGNVLDSVGRDVQGGTQRALMDLCWQVLYEVELPPGHFTDPERWWNGYYAAVIWKTSC